MKRIICLITVLCIVLGSFSFCFAAGWSDSQISSVVSDLSTIKTTINNIYNRLGTIQGYLYENGHSIAYWVEAIDTWMQPIYQSLTSGLASNLDLDKIISGLNEVTGSEGSGYTYTPYLKYNNKSAANYLYDFNNYFLSTTGRTFAGWTSFNGDNISTLYSGTIGVAPYGTQLMTALNYINTNETRGLSMLINRGLTGYNSQQSLVSFADPDSTVTFTPSSGVDGIYKYLNAINTPVARLAYVLASDSRIDAQEAAAANEQAVVDNFIDSSGAGSASPSDIGSLSNLSSGYQDNFGSDASVTGIFNIFNSNNMGWFSQETANQLDTTTPTRRGSSFDTPLLDQQINDIYDQIGVKHD